MEIPNKHDREPIQHLKIFDPVSTSTLNSLTGICQQLDVIRFCGLTRIKINREDKPVVYMVQTFGEKHKLPYNPVILYKSILSSIRPSNGRE